MSPKNQVANTPWYPLTIQEPGEYDEFEISQQSRDAVAVLHAAGEESAYVFGNSSAAVIALDMARTQAQALKAVIVHEAPLARLHPNARKWQRFFASVYLNGLRFGSSMAALQFMLGVQLPVAELIKATKPINDHRAQSSEPYLSDQTTAEVLVKMELLPVTNYPPDVELIKQNGVRVLGVQGFDILQQRMGYKIIQCLVGKMRPAFQKLQLTIGQ